MDCGNFRCKGIFCFYKWILAILVVYELGHGEIVWVDSNKYSNIV